MHASPPRTAPPRRDRRAPTQRARTRGFTYVEVLVAATLIGLALVTATASLDSTVRMKAEYEADSGTAHLLAKEIYELAVTLPSAPSGSLGATAAAEVEALDSLIGASFTPPLRADLTSASEFATWTQQTALTVYDIGDLDTPTGDSAADGIGEQESKLYKLSVTVLQGAEPAGTFHWWIQP